MIIMQESDEERSPKPDDIAAGLVTPMEGLVCLVTLP